MEGELLGIVEERLAASGAEDQPWAMFVLAACEGQESLDKVLGGGPARGRRIVPGDQEVSEEPLGAYIRSVSVEGFRGVGPRRALELTPGPGLTLVVGRNGSGKSSFAEALEILLTGANWRWKYRSVVWREGWRNLHQPSPTRISAELAVEGQPGATTVVREWPDGAELEESETAVSLPSKQKADLAALGWSSALESYRPFLSYNELGSMFDEGPTKLHDRLAQILGLGDLDHAAALLREARLEREGVLNATKKSLPDLLAALDEVDDDRARSAAKALSGRTWNLPAVRTTITVDGAAVEAGETLGVLRALASIETPSLDEVAGAVEELRAAAVAIVAFRGSDAGRAGDTAGLIRDALDFHQQHGDDDCPVCGTERALDAEWRERAKARLAELAQQAREFDAAQSRGRAALTSVQSLLGRPPSVIQAASAAGVDAVALSEAWTSFVTLPDGLDLNRLADHLEHAVVPLEEAAADVRRRAQAELGRREDAWRPAALRLAAWLKEAEEAQEAAKSVPDLKAAEKWLKETSAEIRQLRFEPVASEAIRNWAELRQQSSVEVEAIALEGSGPRRRLRMDVTIDGDKSAALGVMSQGELNSIALGLFLPRATLPESPFRFVVIDDPVQSMDPARVDGLAQVLARTARSRQVVVFTHDDRLPEATRRLGIDARIIEVTRHENSAIDLRQSLDPVSRNLDDARAVAKTRTLPKEVAQEVVPAYCRSAIEAAAIDVVRRRRIGRGEAHMAVEKLINDSKTTNVLLALALWDDPSRGGEVMGSVSKRWGEDVADALGIAVRGAHAGYRGDLEDLVRSTGRLCARISELKA
jgi:recombinational DNA repair ATPase RecF